MGALDAIRGRDDNGRLTKTVVDPSDLHNSKHAQSNSADTAVEMTPDHESPPVSDTDSSFGVNGVDDDEKEVIHNPEHVTDKAALGQQKAEAAAMVWSRKTVAGVYAW